MAGPMHQVQSETTPVEHRDAPLFAFGTLLDPDIVRVVLGHDRAGRLQTEPAELHGFRRRRVYGEPFPMLVPCPGGSGSESVVRGRLLHGLNDRDLTRIRFYEGEGYVLRPLTVLVGAGPQRRRCTARVFLSTGQLRDSGEPWDPDYWERTEKPLAVLLARELMALFGHAPPAGPDDAEWEEIKARCRARLHGEGPAFSIGRT